MNLIEVDRIHIAPPILPFCLYCILAPSSFETFQQVMNVIRKTLSLQFSLMYLVDFIIIFNAFLELANPVREVLHFFQTL